MALVSAGSNAQGQLATGDCEDAHTFTHCRFDNCDAEGLPPGTTKVIQLAFGANHTLLLLDRARDSSSPPTRELWGSGDGSKHQLGPSVQTSVQTFVPLGLPLAALGLQGYRVRSVAACWETSFVALEHSELGDVLLSMGSDDFGDLGVGGRDKGGATRVHRVEFGQECLGADGPRRVRIASLATGAHHVVARLSLEYADRPAGTRLVGWGTARHGQLGDLQDPQTGRPLPFVSSPRAVSLPSPASVVGVALGNQHSVFLLSSGHAAALGSNRRAQLSGLDALSDLSAIGCTWNGSYAVAHRGSAWSLVSTGSAHKGQLGRRAPDAPGAVDFPFPAATRDLVKLACGSEHVLCLFARRDDRARREVWAWGWNEHGTLGHGGTDDQALPVCVWPPDDHSPAAVDVAAGCGNSWIVLSS
ncbi:hypothetical protein PHLGIDRAFT_79659 [Phlebiopsis gigantea 11061_1 CR5-6]|uniref:Uncharacterized protein n=1 Tax=Phlebiopsis gigantea (strain 11061_1 CR5-6) TaxID=745531 RepID=A0A0C3PB13_PHLG1|nr:hypothetical protein PHLGIDRAFT_79659 [Phlebiopsis gigantea 11061_1 CR5-6]